MSWSVYTTASMTEDVSAALDKAFDDAPQAREHAGPQEAAAKEATLALLTAVARDTDEVSIRLSGHYNAGKNPTPGWADCMITVSISQVIPKPTP
jgi:hypothetical protein